MMLTLALIALLQIATEIGPADTIELLPAGAAAPPKTIALDRDQRLILQVIVIAPGDDSEVEKMGVKALNQPPNRWEREQPNLFVTAERVGSDGKREPAHTRVFYTGAGQSLREHFASISIELADEPEVRKQRIRDYFSAVMGGKTSAEGAVAYMDPMYVANPVGSYRVTISYRPKAGVFAGKTLARTFTIDVKKGPDSLDKMSAVGVTTSS
ncbi:MAG TPA: hypothetical protein VEU30_13640 [Thermoanaerobaculia bacterium]|nr:hypothetical protein [Thermoanaerobaculia bacterium]